MKLLNRVYTASVLCAATAMILPAQTVTTLFSFGETNGLFPNTALVQGTDGNLYGTTPYGGINCVPSGCGTAFKITPNGTLTTLYSFCNFSQCPDGGKPFAAPLVQAANGEFYGTTSAGGSSSYCTSYIYPVYPFGCGTVFKMTASGLLTTIYNFCSQVACEDGAQPVTGLVLGTNGVLYGTTKLGGANGAGTIFKITPGGSLTTLYSFCSISGCMDGELPQAGLVQAANGDFYGTTYFGGASTYCPSVFVTCGTVFRITPSGTFKTLYSFCAQSDCTDGSSPNAGLVQASDGDLYGTTLYGGADNDGTVFKVTSSGVLTTLHSFQGTDGFFPYAGLVQATDGNLYGTTGSGPYPGDNLGTIFKITPTGSLTTVFAFPSENAGDLPQSALLQDTNGHFYGTTIYGGTQTYGTIFSLSVGLGPFVKLQPASGKVGELVDILGNNLTGATAVSFNGTPAIFKVVSNALITTNVPSDATTGGVQVTTPGGTLVSNVSFQVRQ
jgi:uncharacterized repeat protein (TIGR03803 family)